MSDLPRALSTGTRLSAHWLNRLRDFLRSRDLLAGPGIRLDRTPSGTTISAASAAVERPEEPLPFDCRVEPDGSGTLHWRCYLPHRRDGLVRLAGGEVKPGFNARGRTTSHDWYDVGSAAKGDMVTLYILCSMSAEDAEEKLASAWWAVAKSKPYGAELGPLGPPMPLAEWTSNGIRQIFHGPYVFGGAEDPLSVDSDANPGNPPGESLNRFAAAEGDEEHPDGQLQLRQFHDTNDTLSVEPVGGTGDGPTAANLDILMRNKGQGTAGARPKLDYVPAADGPFFVKGATADQNYAESIKIGTPATGYVTISVYP